MPHRRRTSLLIVIAFLAASLFGSGALAATDDEKIKQLEEKIDDLSSEVEDLKQKQEAEAAKTEESEEKTDVLARELDRLKRAVAVPEDEELRSVWGLGAGASKVYLREKGLSIGGYGEVVGNFYVNDKVPGQANVADALRFVTYLGYKFNEHIVINSEIEFEHATSSGGSVSVEFLTLDFLLKDEANIRSGLVLAPMGLVNENHEPIFFYGNQRPEPELQIIPTTWREIGGGFFGKLGEDIQYATYAMVSFNGPGFDSSGLRGGRQKGSKSRADDWAFVGRVDWTPLPGLDLGTSVFTGETGQGNVNAMGMVAPDAQTTIYEIHATYTGYNATLRGLWTQAFVNQATELSQFIGLAPNNSIASRMDGGYVTAAYNVLPHVFPKTDMTLEPFFRFEYVNTQAQMAPGLTPNQNNDYFVYVPGLQFKPHPQVVVKLNYRGFEPKAGKRADEIQLGFGFVF